MNSSTPPAVSLFAGWVTSCGSQQEARRQLAAHGVVTTQQTVSRWLRDEMRPDPTLRPGIEAASGGAVPAWSWLTSAETVGLDLPALPTPRPEAA
jgi:hypothetical protein